MKLLHLPLLLLILFLLPGCADETVGGTSGRQDGEGVSINFTVEGELQLSRAVSAMTHEKTLRKVYVLFFDPEEGEQFVAYKAVSVTPGKSSFMLDVPDELKTGVPYKVLAIGNGDTFAPDGRSYANTLSSFVGTYNDAIARLQVEYEGAVVKGTPGEIPFFGKFLDKDGLETTFTVVQEGENKKVTEAEEASFLFSRAICRFDIHNLVGHLLDIRCARVVNSPDAGYLFLDGLNAGRIPAYEPQAAPSGTGYMPITSDMEPGVNTTQRLEGELYGFPNTVNTTVVNDKVTSALMIAGYYIDPVTGVKDTELTYYRFNMANLGEAQLLNRNYCYRATIKGVRRRGAATEQEAYNDATPIFIYDFTPTWDTEDDNVASDKDGNFLIVNKTHLTFQGNASDADFIELHVSTNPELTWKAEWVAQTGHNNDKFVFEKISDSAVKCGPREANNTPYVRYGYINIVATNPKTGKTLKVAVYLMQLSTQYTIRTLSVNGNTGSFLQELSPTGGSVLLPVVTGAADNIWVATDEGNRFKAWDTQGVYLTPSGGNNNQLELRFPANISGADRTATIRVSLVNNETNPDGTKKVPDVVITLSQKKSSQLMDILNFPSNGVLDIQCLSMDAGNENGVVNPMNFVVRLTDSRYRYHVSTNFDKDRDLVLSATSHRGVGSVSPARATHPADGSVNKTDKIEGLESGSVFWLNPFRTGPGDPMIVGNVTVEAYRPDLPSAPKETRAFTVRLLSQDVVQEDVLLKSGNSYYLVADRNYNATSKKTTNGVNIPCEYYTYRTNVKITGKQDPCNFSADGGELITASFTTDNYGYIKNQKYTVAPADMIATWKSNNANVNTLYTQNIWYVPTEAHWNIIKNAIRFSKERAFFVSDYKIANKPVCCWLPHLQEQAFYARDPGLQTTTTVTAVMNLWQVYPLPWTTYIVLNQTYSQTTYAKTNQNKKYYYGGRLIATFASTSTYVNTCRTAYGYTIP